MERKEINENIISSLGTIGKSALKAAKPTLTKASGKVGKKIFRKAAKAGIKKFGKAGAKSVWNATKELAKNKDVQNASKKIAKDAVNWGKNKIKNISSNKDIEECPVCHTKLNDKLVESFSNIVDAALCNEAWGAAIKAGITAGKGLAKGTGKTIAKHGIKGLAKMNKAKLASNVGSAMANDLKQFGKDAFDASTFGAIRNTFKDDKGNWSFNPARGIKKQVKGLVKTADNVFTGGLGQMAYDSATGQEDKQPEENCEKPVKKIKKIKK